LAKASAILLLLVPFLGGCTSTNVRVIETGMFDNEPGKIISAYEKVEQLEGNLEKTQLKKADLEAIGFQFSAPNVEKIPGSVAFQMIFGSLVFADNSGTKSDLVAELGTYQGFYLPYQRISTITDRIYLSHKETFQTGEIADIFFLFKGEELCYYELRAVKIDVYRSHYAAGEILVKVLQVPGEAAYSILEAVSLYKYPGVEILTRIPLIP
jgi:hypothetical protein